MLAFKADELIQKFGTAAVRNIKTDYGENPDITGLWNTTMSTVDNATEQIKNVTFFTLFLQCFV